MSDPGSCLSSRFQQEVAADIALGAAQVRLCEKECGGVEKGEKHTRAAARLDSSYPGGAQSCHQYWHCLVLLLDAKPEIRTLHEPVLFTDIKSPCN